MSEHEVSDGEREGPQELNTPQALEKQKVAADIANTALKLVRYIYNAVLSLSVFLCVILYVLILVCLSVSISFCCISLCFSS